MALLVVLEDGALRSLELEGRTLRPGDPLWVPTGGSNGCLVEAWRAGSLAEVLWESRVIRVRLENGGTELLGFEVALRRRDL